MTSEMPIETNDDAVLRMLGGANFGPNAQLILPSGKTLTGDEAQAMTSAFAPATTKNPQPYPPDRQRICQVTGHVWHLVSTNPNRYVCGNCGTQR